MQNDTLPQILKSNFRTYGSTLVAMRKKERGIWKTYSWRDWFFHVENLSLGLIRLGLAEKESVALIGDNSPKLFWAELAVQSANAKAALIGAHFSAEAIGTIIENLRAPFIIVQDAKVDSKLRKIRHRISGVKKAIYLDDEEFFCSDDPWYLSGAELEEMGQDFAVGNPGLFEKTLSSTKGENICALLYSSDSKPVTPDAVLTHESLIKGVRAFLDADKRSISDDYLSVMPVTSFWEQNLGLTGSLLSGCKLNFCEKAEAAKRDICEISPHFIYCAPQALEGLVRSIVTRFQESGPLIKRMYNLLLPPRLKEIRTCGDGKGCKGLRAVSWWVSDIVLFRHARRRMGLGRAKSVYTDGSPASAESFDLLRGFGINVKQVYRSAENQIGLIEGKSRVGGRGT